MSESTSSGNEIKDGLREVEKITEVIEGDDFIEVVEIEIYAKENKEPPCGRKYKFRIDRDHFTWDHEHIKGEKLFELAKKSPTEYRMHEKLHGGHMREITPGEEVHLRKHGVERFVTMKISEGDGEASGAAVEATPVAPPRRHFRLPGDDEGYLDSLGLPWEAIASGQVRWVLLHDHPVPEGYKQKTTTVAIRIEGGYPPGKLDMASFHPHLVRDDGKAINAVSAVDIDGVGYQQWSRHYDWQEGVHSLATHHLHVSQWLKTEIGR
jgi:hypothetical protein